MFYTIYKTTNLVNGKFYIGKHQTKNLDDKYIGSGKLLRRAVKKYGIDNFHKEILFECRSEEHMNTLEKILVVPDPELNYNLCPGGKGGFGFLNKTGLNNEGKDQKSIGQKISKALKGKSFPHLSERMKERHKAGLVRYDTFTGRKHSEETKRKISEARKKKL
jgi:group I intron endonuclease